MARRPDREVTVPGWWLVQRARRGSSDLSQQELASRAEMAQPEVSRFERGEREPSLEQAQQLVAATDYRLVVQLAREAFEEPFHERIQAPSPLLFEPQGRDVRRRLPEQLIGYRGLPAGSVPGPTTGEALGWLYEVRDLARAARSVEARLQRAYEAEGVQRDRDLIHQVLEVGAGAGQAAAVLTAQADALGRAVSSRRRRGKKPANPRLGELGWAHAVCCLRVEESVCRQRARWMRTALQAAAEHRAATIKVRDLERTVESDRGSSRWDEELEKARAQERRAAARRDTLSQHGPGRDVGNAGERYLAAELDELADTAHDLYTAMADTESFTAWRRTADPLYAAWLDGPLSHTDTPPARYPHKKAFYDAHWQIRSAWERRLDDPGTAPLGSDERQVYDENGIPWMVTLVAPALGDPRDHPDRDCVVVASRHPQGQPEAPLYVLTENVIGVTAADCLAQLPERPSLLDAAVALAERQE